MAQNTENLIIDDPKMTTNGAAGQQPDIPPEEQENKQSRCSRWCDELLDCFVEIWSELCCIYMARCCDAIFNPCCECVGERCCSGRRGDRENGCCAVHDGCCEDTDGCCADQEGCCTGTSEPGGDADCCSGGSGGGGGGGGDGDSCSCDVDCCSD